jgi:FSR family fosmidomycin resistance protein-like MFS transporter
MLAASAVLAMIAAAIAGPARQPGTAGPARRPGTAGPSRQPGAAGPAGATAAAETPGEAEAPETARPAVREALTALRETGAARWLAALQVSDLLLDVLTGYVAVYLVDVAGASPALAALAVAVRLGGGLCGDAIFVLIAGRVSGPVAVRASAAAACVLYPAFLLVPPLPAKLAVLAVLSMVTACWYPAMNAGLFASLPGHSGIAVFWSSAAGLAGAAGPLAVGLIAQQAGLSWALAGLAAVPVAVLVILPRAVRPASHKVFR